MLSSLHQLEVQMVLRIWLPLHVYGIVRQEFLQGTEAIIDRVFNVFCWHIGQVTRLKQFLIVFESVNTFCSDHVSDETSHELIHSDWNVVSLLFCCHFIPKTLQVLLKSYKTKLQLSKIYRLTFECSWWFCNLFPALGIHLHFQILFCFCLADTPWIRFTVHALLKCLPVLSHKLFSLCLSKHVGNLLFRHMNPIFFEQSSDLATIERATTILVQSLEHIINNIIRFYFCSRVIVMLVGILHGSCLEPLLVLSDLKLEFAISTFLGDFWGATGLAVSLLFWRDLWNVVEV